jgi:hypothetical protein
MMIDFLLLPLRESRASESPQSGVWRMSASRTLAFFSQTGVVIIPEIFHWNTLIQAFGIYRGRGFMCGFPHTSLSSRRFPKSPYSGIEVIQTS